MWINSSPATPLERATRMPHPAKIRRNTVALVPAFSLCLTIAGCTTVDVRDAYPNLFYKTTRRAGRCYPLLSNAFSFLQILSCQTSQRKFLRVPEEYAIAHYTGHLLCIMDQQAEITFPSSDNPSIALTSRITQRFLDFANQTSKIREAGLIEYIPQGYPFVACYVRLIPLSQVARYVV
jgi:hypothetical protein